RKRHKESCVDDRREESAELRRNQDCKAAGEPKGGKPGERPTIDRQPPGPVRNRREQEAGDSRCDIAIEHLVNVPIERTQMCRYAQLAHILGNPDKDGDDRPEACRQKERAKAIREKCGTVIVAAALEGGRRHSRPFFPASLARNARMPERYIAAPEHCNDRL